MLVDLKLANRHALVVGGGEEAELKVRKILDSGASVTLIAEGCSEGLKRLAELGRIELLEGGEELASQVAERYRPYLFVAATGDPELDARLARVAKSSCHLVYVNDNPSLSDFDMVAVAKIGCVSIGVSTSGLSPAMARVLRKRIERLITEEDLRMIEVLGVVRGVAKRRIKGREARREALYKVMRSRRVRSLVKAKMLDEAVKHAERILESYAEKGL